MRKEVLKIENPNYMYGYKCVVMLYHNRAGYYCYAAYSHRQYGKLQLVTDFIDSQRHSTQDAAIQAAINRLLNNAATSLPKHVANKLYSTSIGISNKQLAMFT